VDIIFTIPDDQVQRVVDAVAGSFGYDPATDGTKGQFTKKYVVKLLKQITKNYEANQASSSAAVIVLGQADVDVT
jgi:hypothetical protein